MARIAVLGYRPLGGPPQPPCSPVDIPPRRTTRLRTKRESAFGGIRDGPCAPSARQATALLREPSARRRRSGCCAAHPGDGSVDRRHGRAIRDSQRGRQLKLRRLSASASDDADVLRIDIEKCPQPLHPLGEQFRTMVGNRMDCVRRTRDFGTLPSV